MVAAEAAAEAVADSGGSGGSGGGGGGYTTVGGGSAFGGSDEFELPSYNQAPAGSIRFNTDSKKLEVYILSPVGYGTLPNGIWMEVDSWSPELQTGGTRGVFGGGYHQVLIPLIIQHWNNRKCNDFGEFISPQENLVLCIKNSWSMGWRWKSNGPNKDRLICNYCINWRCNRFWQSFVCKIWNQFVHCQIKLVEYLLEETPANASDTIQYITIASTGNAIDFGNLTVAQNLIQDVHHQLVEYLFGGGSWW